MLLCLEQVYKLIRACETRGWIQSKTLTKPPPSPSVNSVNQLICRLKLRSMHSKHTTNNAVVGGVRGEEEGVLRKGTDGQLVVSFSSCHSKII